jgi:hypothetical protein
MSYEVKSGPAPQAVEHRKPKGIKPAYPFRDMAIGQWILVPREEERRLGRAIKNAKYNLGVRLQMQLAVGGKNWIVTRVPPPVPT